MKILITGVTGFVGGHLTESLAARPDVQVVGVARSAQNVTPFDLHACDLCDAAAVEALLRDVRPEQIIHLAGYANAGRSLKEPDAAWAGNWTATKTLYDAVHRAGLQPRILYVGSGLVYGDVASDGAGFTEESVLRPITPYASAKAAADLMSYQYTRTPGLDIVRARPFNHFGPRQSAEYAIGNFARQIAAIEQGKQPPVLQTGNLSASRDLTDVRDVVRAYLLLLEKGRTGEVYNVASGEERTMQAVLDGLLARATTKIEVRTEARLMRAAENLHQRGDASKLRRETGWAPQYPLEQTLADTLDYWRRVADAPH